MALAGGTLQTNGAIVEQTSFGVWCAQETEALQSLWCIETEKLDSGLARLRVVAADGAQATVETVLQLFGKDAAFVDAWCKALSASPMNAYCWECPPLHLGCLSQRFQCVLIESPALGRARPDPAPFAEYFRAGQPVAVFSSLGKDATLIAPSPQAGANFAHLASFLRTADPAHRQALWRQVGISALALLGREPVWLSTAGLGVSWLHVRLDSRPKYYRYRAYRDDAVDGRR